MTNLTSIDQWKELLKQSADMPIIIYKHSTTCPVSAAAFERISQSIEAKRLTEPVYIIVVQESREVSNAVAEELGIKHESPQVIVVQNNKALYHASHHAIDPEEIAKYIETT